MWDGNVLEVRISSSSSSSLSQGIFYYLLPKTWKWWHLREIKDLAKEKVEWCGRLHSFSWGAFSWEVQGHCKNLAGGGDWGVRDWARGEQLSCWYSMENSLPPWSPGIYCFSYFFCKSGWWNGAFFQHPISLERTLTIYLQMPSKGASSGCLWEPSWHCQALLFFCHFFGFVTTI